MAGRVVLGFHPYAQTADSLPALVAEIRKHTDLPLWADEWGIPRGDLHEVAAQHSALLEAMWRLGIEGTCVFPWSSAMHDGFDGLVDAEGVPNEIYAAVVGAAVALAGPPPGELTTAPPTLVLDAPGNMAGHFTTTPEGIILHATRSGRNWSEVDEFEATVGYVRSGASGLGWNATIGPGLLALHMDPGCWGWNAREASPSYLAIEFAQARLGVPISESTLDAAAHWIREHALARWPSLPLNFPMHSELPAGVRDGKTDIFQRGSPECDAFRERLRSRL